MMEAIMTQKVTPLLKCFVLFLFIFTAKVLTSRPNEVHDSRNGIHHVKPAHYVRTFTKYHHRRTIQWNNHELQNDWPLTQDQSKSIGKRSIRSDWPKNIEKQSLNIPFSKHNRNKRSVRLDSNKIIEQNIPDLNNFNSDVRENLNFDKNSIGSGKEEQSTKNGVNEVRKYKVKAAVELTDAPTTIGPTISCLYKIHSVARSVTPSYTDETNAQFTVENDIFDTGTISEEDLPDGPAEIEKCTDPKATCYTLWHQDNDGNITVLGQGCWKSSVSQTEGQGSCDTCTRVTARLPGTKFCCCTKSYCNADFTSLRVVESVTIKAKSSMAAVPSSGFYWNLCGAVTLAVLALLAMAAVLRAARCRPPTPPDVEKGDVMGSGPDSLATGLLCVDNLTLTEHIGQGKFGSVWRGTLGSTPVAVKLYSNASTWQKEADIYALPQLSHSNLLRYYGSDARPTLTDGGREHLIVLELCKCTLRARLEEDQCTWMEFATIAHGIASALAHLHTPTGSKPCIVHRDVNSNNVLMSYDGTCRLADLGLAQALRPRSANTAPTRYTEAGTLRYLAPEALEGALDLSYFGSALCAVDVYALGLVLWEVLWRTGPAHRGQRAPPYAPPYHQAISHQPNAHHMQTLVSRNKVRPPMPKGPVPEWRALRIASDTCEECWDHDAEARLTAVCVEERMSELKQLLSTPAPVIHDNKLQNNAPPTGDPYQPETEKRSNCTITVTCDVNTPLLYYPPVGRNTCIERNTHRDPAREHTLVHKSLKDIHNNAEPSRQNINENCISVARISHRIPIQENSILSERLSDLNEIRSYQRPLDYVQNDVTYQETRGPKQTNLLHDVKIEKPKWGLRKFFQKLNRKDTEVKLFPECSQKTKTSIVNKPMNTVFNLAIDEERDRYYEAPCLSPPNKTLSPTMMDAVFKELPHRDNEASNQIFAVIVPKAKVEVRKQGSSESINKSVRNASRLSMFKSNSESEDSTVKKRLSSDKNSASSSRASINLELQYIDNTINPFDLSDTSSSEDENLMLLSENGGSKITMQAIPKEKDVLKESSQAKAVTTNNLNKYTNLDNEYSDPNDKENLQTYSVDNPVYLAAINGEITTDLKLPALNDTVSQDKPKPCLKTLTIKRQRSLEHVSELFSSSADLNLQNPAGRVKTPGDIPVAVRRARSRALQKGRASEANRLSLYDDRMMFGNSL